MWAMRTKMMTPRVDKDLLVYLMETSEKEQLAVIVGSMEQTLAKSKK
jgi:hypothetical protein